MFILRILFGTARRRSSFSSVALALLVSLGALPAHAEYSLSSGDVVQIGVYNVPALQTEATVDIDGRIAFGPLGLIEAKGLSLPALSEQIRAALRDKQILNDAQVTIALVAARPIFIGGDVSSPGAYPYRADLTVRQAIALAGGLGLARIRGFDDLAQLRGARQSLAVELLREHARFARAEAALKGEDKLSLAPDSDMGVSGSYRDEVIALETRNLLSDEREAKEEKEHLLRSLDLIRLRIETLKQQRALLGEQLGRQEEEMRRIREIREQGLAAQTRVVEEQRVYDSMQARAADNAAEIASVQGQFEQANYDIQRFDDRRASALEDEKRASLLEIGRLEGELWGVEERLAQLGSISSNDLIITLYRAKDGKEVAETVESGTPLNPGDTLEITAVPSLPAGMTQMGQATARIPVAGIGNVRTQ